MALAADCPRCEKCNRSRAEMKCHLDVYNDFDDEPGNLICDDCLVFDEPPVAYVMPARPEGYYHCAPGTFD
jgi:hypothetical protein